jgi:hypothetical protein
VIDWKLEWRIEMTGRRGRRRKQLLVDLKEKRRYWKFKEEALDRTRWRTRFGRGYGPVLRQAKEWMNDRLRLPSMNQLSIIDKNKGTCCSKKDSKYYFKYLTVFAIIRSNFADLTVRNELFFPHPATGPFIETCSKYHWVETNYQCI